jgi:hypothetical protein
MSVIRIGLATAVIGLLGLSVGDKDVIARRASLFDLPFGGADCTSNCIDHTIALTPCEDDEHAANSAEINNMQGEPHPGGFMDCRDELCIDKHPTCAEEEFGDLERMRVALINSDVKTLQSCCVPIPGMLKST